MAGAGLAPGFLTPSLPEAVILLIPRPVGFQDPLAQPLHPGGPRLPAWRFWKRKNPRVDPFPGDAGWPGPARGQLQGQLAPEAVAMETQTDVLLNS